MASVNGGGLRADLGLLLLRLGVAVLLMLHGVAKLQNGIGWMEGPLRAIGLPMWVGYGAFIGEILAPLFLIVGKFTRLAGLIVAFDMFMAVLVARRDAIATRNQGGGWGIELEMLFLLGGVVIALLGSGRYAASRGEGSWD